jgi:hypothetical protein
MLWFVMLFVVGICLPTNCNDLIQAIHYEPASIGEDPLSNEIDFYTNLYLNFHNVFLDKIKELNATHVIVGPIWNLCDNDCHGFFLRKLHQNNLKLINTLTGSGDNREIEIITQNAKEILKESIHKDVFYGFYVPALDSMATYEEWENYYTIFIKGLNDLTPTTAIIVELPINYNQGIVYPPFSSSLKSLLKEQAHVAQWVIKVYDSNSYHDYLNIYNTTSVKGPCLPFIYTSDFSKSDDVSGSDKQLQDLTGIINAINNTNYAIFEFSDSWWRSAQSNVGENLAGCPNLNSYGHSACGLIFSNFSDSVIVYIEWLGIFSVSSHPLQLCLTPKKIASYIKSKWNSMGCKNQTCDDVTEACAPVDIFFWLSTVIYYKTDFWFPIVVFTSPFVFFSLITALVYCFANVPK